MGERHRRNAFGIRLATAAMQPAVAGLVGAVLLASAAAYVSGLGGFLEGGVWIWLLVWGLVCAAALVVLNFGDPEEQRRRLEEELTAQTRRMAIRDPDVARLLEAAIGYRLDMQAIERSAAAAAGGLLEGTIGQIAQWLSAIAQLAHHVDEGRKGARQLAVTMTELRERIDGLEARAAESTDKALARTLRDTIAGRRHQLRTAEAQLNLDEQAALRLEQAVAALASVSMHIAMVARKESELSDLDGLHDGINGEIDAITQLLSAYERTNEERISVPTG